MKLPFHEEFEICIQGNIYFVEAEGIREWDEEERLFTSLSKLSVTNELGNELNDNDDIYNEIAEHILHTNDPIDSLTEDSRGASSEYFY